MSDQHKHAWQRVDAGFACTDCTAMTAPCNTCMRPLTTELAICAACITKARKIITDIQAVIHTIPDVHAALLGMKAIRFDKPILGSADPARLPFGLDAMYDDLDKVGMAGIHTPEGTLNVLVGWAKDWADTRVDVVGDVLVYLDGHTLWAAQNHPAWAEYLEDAYRVRSKLRHLAGLNPEVQDVPCVYCGGRVVQEWTKDGLDDVLTCAGCNVAWPNTARFAFASRTALFALPKTHPDALVTIEDVKRICPHIRGNLLDLWVNRGKANPDNARLTTLGKDERGRPTYRLADVIAAWEGRETTGWGGARVAGCGANDNRVT